MWLPNWMPLIAAMTEGLATLLRRKMAGAAGLVALAGFVNLIGCGAKPPCIKGGEPGRGYVATLGEEYTPTVTDVAWNSNYTLLMSYPTCAGIDTLGTGSNLSFKINNFSYGPPGPCTSYFADVEPPSAVTTIPGVGDNITGHQSNALGVWFGGVNVGGCAGRVEVQFISLSGDPFAPNEPGKVPSLLTMRVFSGDGADCPSFESPSSTHNCADTWVSTLASQ